MPLQAVNLHKLGAEAFFQENDTLAKWVNQQPSSKPLICLGDGHQGIWNIFAMIGDWEKRREILDWYHLVENLGKVGGSIKRLARVEAWLSKGRKAKLCQSCGAKHQSFLRKPERLAFATTICANALR